MPEFHNAELTMKEALWLVITMAGQDREVWFGQANVDREMKAVEMCESLMNDPELARHYSAEVVVDACA